MRLLKTVLITVGILAFLWVCAPLLIGTMFWFIARSQYNATEPSKVSTLQIPDSNITIALFRKPQPRAICSEGEYRILEVSRPARSNLYFELLPTSAGDNPHLKAYWFPSNQCLKVIDSGTRSGSGESVLFLKSATIVHLCDGGRGSRMTTDPKPALPQLKFPSASAQWSLAFTETTITTPEGNGIFVGTLEEPRREEPGPSTPAGDIGNRTVPEK